MAAQRAAHDLQRSPMRIYEVHLGSWRRGPRGRFLTYEEIGPLLAEHCLRLGFTHVELLPLAEHPFYGSWGYQVTGFHAPTARYGTPDQLRGMVDLLHRSGIGVHPGLGARPLRARWLRARPLRRDAPLRGSRPAAPRPPRLGDDRLRLRPAGDPRLPDRQRALLARGVPRRWAAGRCGRLDALPGLLAQEGPVDAEPPRRQPQPRGDLVPPGAEHARACRSPRRDHDRRGVDRLQGGQPPGRRWRPRASTSSGTSAGCTTRWSTSASARLSAGGTGARSPSAASTSTRSAGSCRSRTTRWCTRSDLCSGRCAGTPRQQFAGLRSLLANQVGQPGKKLLFMGTELAPTAEWNHDRQLPWKEADGDPARETLRADTWPTWQRCTTPRRHSGRATPTRRASPGSTARALTDASVVAWLRRGALPAAAEEVTVVVQNGASTARRRYRLGLPASGRWEVVLSTDAARLRRGRRQPRTDRGGRQSRGEASRRRRW